jgi:ribosomal-protein-alanine N-acetyltransferase
VIPGPDPRFERQAYLEESWRPREELAVPVLRTERLVLRGWTDADRTPFAALNADPAVMEHFPSTLSRGESNKLVVRIRQHFADHGYGLWAVEAEGRFVGFTGLQWSEWTGTHELEIGWRLARSAWGHGWATEAAAAALAYGLARVPRVVSFTALPNLRSQAVMKRIGMRLEREFDHPGPGLDDRLRRHVLYVAP